MARPVHATGGGIFVPSSAPIIRNGETWIYYFGYRHGHNAWGQFQYLEDHDNDVRDQASYLLAKMPEDQWVSLDAGTVEGWVLGKPWLLPTQVLVNSDVAEGGFIAAEFVTPYGKPVEGLTRAECVPVTPSGKDQVLEWTSDVLASELQQEHLGGLCIKFYLKNAKLYSYSFMQPDPDGEIATDWANARWLETIKHRSDNWDRLSTEPAAGVPARPGAQGRHSKRYGPYPRPPAKRR